MQRSARRSKGSRREAMRERRHLRIRRKVTGTLERPRLAVHRSLKHVLGQIIDDGRGVTLVGVTSADRGLEIRPASPAAATDSTAAPADSAAEAVAEAGGKPGKGAGKGAKSEKAEKGGKGEKAGKAKARAGEGRAGAKPAAEGAKAARARAAGRLLAERARAKGIQRVVFDRGGYVFHGRVRAFAEGAREGGLEF